VSHIVWEVKSLHQSGIIPRSLVFSNAVGLSILDACNSFKKQVNEAYSLSWLQKKRLSESLETEFHIWAWAMANHYGARFLIKEGNTKDASTFQFVLSDYFKVVSPAKSTHATYKFWIEYPLEVSRMIEVASPPEGHDEAVAERLANMLSLRVLKLINPNSIKLSHDEMERKWGKRVASVRDNLDTTIHLILDVVNHYFNVASQKTVESAFEAVMDKSPVSDLLKKWALERGESPGGNNTIH
jgi:hypothetical protein